MLMKSIALVALAVVCLIQQQVSAAGTPAPDGEETKELTFKEVPSDEQEVSHLKKKFEDYKQVCYNFRDFVVDDIRTESDRSMAKKLYGTMFKYDSSLIQRMKTSKNIYADKSYVKLCERLNVYKKEFRRMCKQHSDPIRKSKGQEPLTLHELKCQTGYLVVYLDAACKDRDAHEDTKRKLKEKYGLKL